MSNMSSTAINTVSWHDNRTIEQILDATFDPIYIPSTYSLMLMLLWDAVCTALLFRWHHTRTRRPFANSIPESNQMMFTLSNRLPVPVLAIIRGYIVLSPEDVDRVDQMVSITIQNVVDNNQVFRYTDRESAYKALKFATTVRYLTRFAKLLIWIAIVAYRANGGTYHESFAYQMLLQLVYTMPRGAEPFHSGIEHYIQQDCQGRCARFPLYLGVQVLQVMIVIVQVAFGFLGVFYAIPEVIVEFFLGFMWILLCAVVYTWVAGRCGKTTGGDQAALHMELIKLAWILFAMNADIVLFFKQLSWTDAIRFHGRLHYARAPQWEDLLTIL